MFASFPDPRPVVAVDAQGVARIAGWRCVECALALAVDGPCCPRCRSALRAEDYGPRGEVWSSTVVRVALPGRTPPYELVYVDLENGPRVLGQLVPFLDQVIPAGTPVVVAGTSAIGDLTFEIDAKEA